VCVRGGCSRRHGRGAYVLNSNKSQIRDSKQRENERESSPHPLASAHKDSDWWSVQVCQECGWYQEANGCRDWGRGKGLVHKVVAQARKCDTSQTDDE